MYIMLIILFVGYGCYVCSVKRKVMSKYDSNFVWIDMEMIGLDFEICVVMEIVIIVIDV